MAPSADRFVWLRGGLVVPIEPLLLVLRLEAAGFTFRLAPDGAPLIGPFDRLAPDDLACLRRWRHHVELLLRYTPDDSHPVRRRRASHIPDDGAEDGMSAGVVVVLLPSVGV